VPLQHAGAIRSLSKLKLLPGITTVQLYVSAASVLERAAKYGISSAGFSLMETVGLNTSNDLSKPLCSRPKKGMKPESKLKEPVIQVD